MYFRPVALMRRTFAAVLVLTMVTLGAAACTQPSSAPSPYFIATCFTDSNPIPDPDIFYTGYLGAPGNAVEYVAGSNCQDPIPGKNIWLTYTTATTEPGLSNACSAFNSTWSFTLGGYNNAPAGLVVCVPQAPLDPVYTPACFEATGAFGFEDIPDIQYSGFLGQPGNATAFDQPGTCNGAPNGGYAKAFVIYAHNKYNATRTCTAWGATLLDVTNPSTDLNDVLWPTAPDHLWICNQE